MVPDEPIAHEAVRQLRFLQRQATAQGASEGRGGRDHQHRRHEHRYHKNLDNALHRATS
jgi:hypothetical protein